MSCILITTKFKGKNRPNIGLHTDRCYAAKGILALPEKSWVGFLVLPEPQRQVKPGVGENQTTGHDKILL